MTTNEMKIFIKADEHANLDSFPFRFGYSFEKSCPIILRDYERIRDELVLDPDHRMAIIGWFTLPKDGRDYKAKFVIMKKSKRVVTVIRQDQWLKTEEHLSETLRSLRESGDIGVNELIGMFDKMITKRDDVVRYLVKTLNQDKIEAAELEAKRKVHSLSDALRKTNKVKEELVSKNDELSLSNEQLVVEIDQAVAEAKRWEKLFHDGNKPNGKSAIPRNVSNSFKVLDAGLGRKGKNNQPAVYLDISDGEATTRIWNNWAVEQLERLELAQALIGETITYNTKGTFNDEWFHQLFKV
jgi:hypothetical protein